MKRAMSLGSLTAMGLFSSFFGNFFIVYKLGPGHLTDSYFASLAVPQFLVAVFSAALVPVIVPIISGEDPRTMRALSWLYFLVIALLSILFAWTLTLAAPFWIEILFPGFEASTRLMTLVLTRVHLIAMVFTVLSAVLVAIHHAHKRFVWAESVNALASIISLVAVVWALLFYDVMVVAWCIVLRYVLVTLLLFPGLGRFSVSHLPFSLVKESLKRSGPLLLGALYYKSEIVINRFLLSMSASGSLSLFFLAQQVYSAVGQLSYKALMAPELPTLSEYVKQQNWEAFKKLYHKKLIQLGGGALVFYAGICILGGPLSQILELFDGVKGEDARLLWLILVTLGGVLLGSVAGQACTSFFYALGRTKEATVVGVLGYSFGIFCKLVGFKLGGVLGLALGTSVYVLLNCSALFWWSQYHSKRFRCVKVYV